PPFAQPEIRVALTKPRRPGRFQQQYQAQQHQSDDYQKGQTWAWLVQRRASELVVGPRDAPRVKASAAKVAPRAQLPSVIISTTAAVAAPVTRPVPMPVISRATPRWLMLLANMNSVEPTRMN